MTWCDKYPMRFFRTYEYPDYHMGAWNWELIFVVTLLNLYITGMIMIWASALS